MWFYIFLSGSFFDYYAKNIYQFDAKNNCQSCDVLQVGD